MSGSSAARCATCCSGVSRGELDLVVEGDAAAVARRVAERLGGRSSCTSGSAPPPSSRLPASSTSPRRARRPTRARRAARGGARARRSREDLARRDFTVNAIAVRLADGGGRGVAARARGPRGAACCASCTRARSSTTRRGCCGWPATRRGSASSPTPRRPRSPPRSRAVRWRGERHAARRRSCGCCCASRSPPALLDSSGGLGAASCIRACGSTSALVERALALAPGRRSRPRLALACVPARRAAASELRRAARRARLPGASSATRSWRGAEARDSRCRSPRRSRRTRSRASCCALSGGDGRGCRRAAG